MKFYLLYHFQVSFIMSHSVILGNKNVLSKCMYLAERRDRATNHWAGQIAVGTLLGR